MKMLKIGSSGLHISALSLGSMHASSLLNPNSTKAIGEAIEAGVNYIDTADSYNQQGCKQVIDIALGVAQRNKLLIGTKCFFPTGKGVHDRGLGRKHILQSIEDSLRNLRLDYFDLFFLHRYDLTIPMEETLIAVQTLMQMGKVRQWGFSAFSPFQACEAYYTAQNMNIAMPVVAQYAYNLFNRSIEMELAEVMRRLCISVIAYYPLAQGILSGKYSNQETAVGRASNSDLRKLMWDFSDEKLQKAKLFSDFARNHNFAPSTLALAWCLKHHNVCSVLTNVNSSQQLAENLSSTAANLSDDVWKQMEAIFGNAPINPYTGAAYLK